MTNEPTPQFALYGQYAGFASRLVAFVIDRLIVGVITAVIVFMAEFAMNAFNVNEWLGLDQLAVSLTAILFAAVVVSVDFLYTVGLWMLAGQTPGKRVMGVRIVRSDGERVRWRNAIVRWVCYWLSAILFLGFLWVLVDNRRQGFHDKLGRTIVIYSWPEVEPQARPSREQVHRTRQSRGTAKSSNG
jgi:uncharacterized RDD family membrane protein YckC